MWSSWNTGFVLTGCTHSAFIRGAPHLFHFLWTNPYLSVKWLSLQCQKLYSPPPQHTHTRPPPSPSTLCPITFSIHGQLCASLPKLCHCYISMTNASAFAQERTAGCWGTHAGVEVPAHPPATQTERQTHRHKTSFCGVTLTNSTSYPLWHHMPWARPGMADMRILIYDTFAIHAIITCQQEDMTFTMVLVLWDMGHIRAHIPRVKDQQAVEWGDAGRYMKVTTRTEEVVNEIYTV